MRQPRSAAAAAALYLLLTVVLTWPLARGLRHDLPADFGDPLLNCWVLAWDADHMLRVITGEAGALREYWNANIFYPHPRALAYSEHLTPQAITILPVYAVTKNPILCYNLVFLSTFVLSALGMFLFVFDLTGSRAAAFLAGFAYGFAPYRFGALSHIQVLSSMWMPFAWLGFHRFFATRRVRPLAVGTVAYVIQNLSCGYYLLFFTPVLLIYVLWEIARRKLWTDARVLGALAAAAVLAVAVTTPFVIPYFELRRLGFAARSLAEAGRFSADVHAYGTTDIGMRLWGRLIRSWPTPEGSLFPGLAIATLATFAIAACWRSARENLSPARRPMSARLLAWTLAIIAALFVALLMGWTLRATVAGVEVKVTSLYRLLVIGSILFAALIATSFQSLTTARRWFGSHIGMLSIVTAFAMAMSFGPEIRAHGKLVADENLYTFFYSFVPGFDGLRVPARYGMIVALGLSGLAGCGAAVLARHRFGVALGVLATALMIAESWAVPIPINLNSTEYKQSGLVPLPGTLAFDSATPPVYHFVARLPAASALIEFPFGEVAFETRYMFYSIFHWKRLVNGYSGGAPKDYGLWAERFKDVLDAPESAWQAVLESRATHLLVHESSYAGDRGTRISQWARAHGAGELAVFDTDRVFSITPVVR
ncbi:MAG: hypothetical protein C5B57_04425 [Blastocatellia bacterium]|nr:MAG: hypothetical protein C5B57_04425 [Blastocatellia bacterium]